MSFEFSSKSPNVSFSYDEDGLRLKTDNLEIGPNSYIVNLSDEIAFEYSKSGGVERQSVTIYGYEFWLEANNNGRHRYGTNSTTLGIETSTVTDGEFDYVDIRGEANLSSLTEALPNTWKEQLLGPLSILQLEDVLSGGIAIEGRESRRSPEVAGYEIKGGGSITATINGVTETIELQVHTFIASNNDLEGNNLRMSYSKVAVSDNLKQHLVSLGVDLDDYRQDDPGTYTLGVKAHDAITGEELITVPRPDGGYDVYSEDDIQNNTSSYNGISSSDFQNDVSTNSLSLENAVNEFRDGRSGNENVDYITTDEVAVDGQVKKEIALIYDADSGELIATYSKDSFSNGDADLRSRIYENSGFYQGDGTRIDLDNKSSVTINDDGSVSIIDRVSSTSTSSNPFLIQTNESSDFYRDDAGNLFINNTSVIAPDQPEIPISTSTFNINIDPQDIARSQLSEYSFAVENQTFDIDLHEDINSSLAQQYLFIKLETGGAVLLDSFPELTPFINEIQSDNFYPVYEYSEDGGVTGVYLETENGSGDYVRAFTGRSYEVKQGSVVVSKDSNGVNQVLVDVNGDGQASLDVSNIGSTIGSTIGSLIAGDDQITQLVSSTLFSAIGANIADTLAIATTEATLGEAASEAFGDFDLDLQGAAVGAVQGAISSFVTAELVQALGLEGQAADFASSVGGAYVSEIVAAGSFENADFSKIEVGNIIASYIGGQIGAEVYDVKSKEGAIGASVGATIGAEIGTAILPGIGTLIGAAIGYIVGGVFGDTFGGTPRSGADVIYDHETGQFVVENVWSHRGGSKDAARGLANTAATTINGLIEGIGGEIINDGVLYGGTYGMRRDKFSYRPEGKQSPRKVYDSASESISYGVIHAIDDLKIAGGNIYIKRATYLTAEDLLNQVEAAQEGLTTLQGNVSVASDYAFYLENADEINAVISTSPDSAFSAGWIATLQLAYAIGLNRRHESDHFGGWQYIADSETTTADSPSGIREVAANFNDFELAYNETDGRIINVTRADSSLNTTRDYVSQDQKTLISFVSQSELNTLVAAAQASQAADEPNPPATYALLDDGHIVTATDAGVSDALVNEVDVAAVIYGSANKDVINAGDLGNDVFGAEGNDTITGGKSADWLFGGEGNDVLNAVAGNNNALFGEVGNDTLEGGEGSDWLDGGAGNDSLLGHAGDDVLDGGLGSDNLQGGAGNDTYLFSRGDGQSIISDQDDSFDESAASTQSDLDSRNSTGSGDSNFDGLFMWREGIRGGEIGGGTDTIEFAEGISLNHMNIRFDKSADKLIITLLDDIGQSTSDSITINNWSNAFRRIEKLRFADGQEVDLGNFQSFIFGTDSDDELPGTDGADFIHGSLGDDQISALAGDDVAIGGLGNDMVSGDADDDLVVGGDGNDNLFGNHGNDIVSGDAGDDVLAGGIGNDVLSGGAGNDVITTGSGDDTVIFGRGDGHDILADSRGESLLEVASWGAFGIVFTAGYNWDGSAGNTALYNYSKSRLNDNIVRIDEGSSWKLYALVDGEDNSVTDLGNDTLEFKMGVSLQDIRVQTSGGDLLIGIEDTGTFRENFSDLKNTVRIEDWFGDAAASIENFRVFGLQDIDATSFNLWLGGNNGDENFIGSAGRDWITSGAGQDVITAHDGNDIISAGAGNDLIHAGAGADVILGGQGFDTLSYEGADSGVIIDLTAKAGQGGQADGDRIDNVENLIGSNFDDILVGDAEDNELSGNQGNDYLVGGLGDDIYLFSRGDNTVTISEKSVERGVEAGGLDAIHFDESINIGDVSFSRSEDPNNFDLTIHIIDTSDSIVIENWFFDLDDRIETLYFVDGGAVDIQYMLFEPGATDLKDWLSGDDTNNVLNGLDNDDILSGRAGDDVLNGDAGDDTLIGGSGADVLDGGQGEDTAVYFDSAGGVNVALDNSSVATGGTAAGDTFSSIENIVGSKYTDQLTGSAVNNKITGGLGNDVIDGKGGADIIYAGEGSDTVLGGTGQDTVIAGEGADEVYGGTGDDIISAGADNDIAFGNQGNDTIDGGGGNDELHGGADRDLLIGDDGSDRLYGEAGNDELRGGDGDDTLLGGAGNDSLFAEAGNDTVYGESGQDYISGGAGNDVIEGGSSDDVIEGGAGQDQLRGDDGSDVLTGGEGNDAIYGGYGNDVLIGDAGNDYLKGGSGSDVYMFMGDFGQDVIAETSDVQAQDNLLFSGFALNQLWFAYDNSDLVVYVIGTTNTVRIQNFANSNIEAINLDGYSISNEELLVLIDSMAGLAIPDSVDDIPSLITDSQTDLWQEDEDDTSILEERIEYAPTLANEIFELDEDTTFNGQLEAVDKNDDEILSYTVNQQPANGTLIINEQTGEFSFVPATDFYGVVDVVVTVTDYSELSSEALLRFQVNPVDDMGDFAANISLATTEDSPITGDLDFFDSDNVFGDYEVSNNAALGNITFDIDGRFTYTPHEDAEGQDDFSITFVDRNGEEFTTQVSVRIFGENDRPDTPELLTFDAQEDGIVQGQISVVDADAFDTHNFQLLSPGEGELTWQQGGHFTYNLAPDFSGEDRFTVRVADSSGDALSYSDTEVVINVAEVNDAPTSVSTLVLTTSEDDSVDGDLELNDVDTVSGDTHTFSSLNNIGAIVFNQDGTFNYTPQEDFNGTDSFSVVITDSSGATTETVVSIDVSAVNDAPEVRSDFSLTTDEDQAVLGDLQLFDADAVYGDSHTFEAAPNKGSIQFNSDGTFVYTPDADVNGQDTFTVTATDSEGAKAQTTVTVDITPVNDAPTTDTPVEITTLDNQEVAGSLQLQDIDLQHEGDSFTFEAQPSMGSIVFNTDGTFTYTPQGDLSGEDRFTVTVTDSAGATSHSELVITISPSNTAPETDAQVTLLTSEDNDVSGDLNLVDNDISKGDSHTFSANPTMGTVIFNADGTFIYSPNANAHGQDTFTVTVLDSHGLTSQTDVVVDVSPVNDAPISDLLVNLTTDEDVSVNGDLHLINLDAAAGDTHTFSASPSKGQVNFNADGTFTYAPNSDENGTDQFTVTVTDSLGETSTTQVTVNITPVNDAPQTPATLNINTNEDIAVIGQLVVSDPDVTDSHTYSVVGAGSGEISWLGNGQFNYTPAQDFNGQDIITVEVTDSAGETSQTQIVIDVAPVNDAPLGGDIYISIAEDNPLVLNLPVTDVEGDAVTITQVRNAFHGSSNINTGNQLNYNPGLNFNGSDSILLRADDGNNGISDMAVNVFVTPVNDDPYSVDMVIKTEINTVATGAIWAADYDIGDVLTYSLIASGTPHNGDMTIDAASGRFNYQPDNNFNGTDVYDVLIADDAGGSTTIRVAMIVDGVSTNPNQSPPEFVDTLSFFSTNEDEEVELDLTAMDIDGDVLIYSIDSTLQPIKGALTEKSGYPGIYIYTPNQDENGADSFRIIADDGNGGTDSMLVQINVAAVNDVPVLGDQTVNGNEDELIDVVVASVSDVDGDTLTFSISQAASNGTVTLINPLSGRFNYQGDANFDGSDSFNILVDDGKGGSAEATITVNLASVNDAPEIAPLSTVLVNEDDTVASAISAFDPDGDSLSYVIASGGTPTHGVVILNSDGSFNYTPDADFNGTDSFIIETNDGQGLANSVVQTVVNVSVAAINDSPFNIQWLGMFDVDEDAIAGTQIGIARVQDVDLLDATITDIHSYALTDDAGGRFVIDPSTGVISLAAGAAIDAETISVHAIEVTVTDSAGKSIAMSRNITINNVNEPPIAYLSGGFSILENSAAVVQVGQVIATDPEGDTLVYSLLDSAGGRFSIDNQGRVFTTQTFNYEQDTSFDIEMMVSDGEFNINFPATVTVNDANDAPVLTVTGSYILDENNIADVLVATANTTDQDVGDTQTYSLLDDHGGRFRIDALGQVFANAGLFDHEQADSYQLDIQVTDSGGLADTVIRIINVNDINEAPTDIVPDSTFAINASDGNSVLVGTVSVVDEDVGDIHSFELVDDAGGRFTIDGQGRIHTALTSYISDAGSTINVEVKVTDSGGETRNEIFTIDVLTSNRAPTDITWAGDFEVEENTGADQPMGTALVVDPDSGDTHTYTLLDDAGGRFRIDPATGVIYTNSSNFNYEDLQAHNIKVQVTDASGASYSENIGINVLNQNESPHSLVVSGSLSIPENAGSSQLVGQVSAVDPENEMLTYRLTGDAGGRFSMDAAGNIFTTQSFNYEQTTSYQITVEAEDIHGLAISQAATVQVTNVNEQPNVLVFSGSFRLNENLPAGTVVGTVSASDPDGTIPSLSLVANGSGLFQLVGGQIRTTRPLNYEVDGSSFNLVVRASDGNLIRDGSKIVQLDDVNESPTGIALVQPLIIEENSSGSALVGRVQGIDGDIDDTITYSLTNDAGGRFIIDSSGYVRVKPTGADINFEDASSHSITVRATDDGGKTFNKAFTVAVTDADDTPTDINWAGSTPSIIETTSPGALVGGLNVTDEDTNPAFRQYTYSMGNSAGGRFTINPSTGAISVGSTSLDVPAGGGTYTVRVKVADADDPTSFFEKDLPIQVSNANSKPTVIGGQGGVLINEYSAYPSSLGGPTNGANVDMTFYNLDTLFSDPDEDVLSYTVTGGNVGGAFKTIGNQLAVDNAAQLNYESQKIYTLQVEAFDGELTNTSTVVVTLDDVPEIELISSASSGYVIQSYKVGYDEYYPGIPAYVPLEVIHGSFGVVFQTVWSPLHSGSGTLVASARSMRAGFFTSLGFSFAASDYNYFFSAVNKVGAPGSLGATPTNSSYFWRDWNYFLSPINLDLDDDGLDWSSSVLFDMDSDGELESTAWVGADDGFLALDRDGNGLIDNGSEISFVADLNGASTDLEGLAAFDSNEDGVLSADDTRFNEFIVWQDANQDGISDEGEMQTLAEAGIESINLLPIPNVEPDKIEVDTEGVGLLNTSNFTLVDGSTSLVGDVRFGFTEVDLTSAEFAPITLGTNQSDTIIGLLSSDNIQTLAGNDQAFGGKGNDWLDGGDGDDFLSGEEGDDLLLGAAGNDTLHGGAGNDELQSGAGDDNLIGNAGDDILLAGSGSDTLHGGEGDDHLDGGEGVDELIGGSGADILIGDAGDDVITAGDGDDLIAGGTGNDLINIGSGLNQLSFASGDGLDRIQADEGGSFILNLVGIDPTDVIFTSQADELIISFQNVLTDQIIIEGFSLENAFDAEVNPSLSLVGVNFLSGETVWSRAELQDELYAQLYPSLTGTLQDDTITGSDYSELIEALSGHDNVFAMGGDDDVYGHTGNDYLNGEAGDDYLDGGAGNDSLDGYTGNDQLYGQSGNDVINGGQGADYLDGGEGDDSLSGDQDNDIVYAGAGNDTLIGGQGDDFLDGGADADYILGESGNDTLAGGEGDDQLIGGQGDDVLLAGTGNDTIEGGEGSDLIEGGDGNNLIVFKRGDGVDTVVIGSATYSLDLYDIDPSDVSSLLKLTSSDDNYNYGDLILELEQGDRIVFEGVQQNDAGASLLNSIRFITQGLDGTTTEWIMSGQELIELVAEAEIIVNEAPLVAADKVITTQDTSVVISVAEILANDVDPEGDALVVTGVTNVQNGTAVFDAAAQLITFTPDAGFAGFAKFDYIVSDGTVSVASNVAVTVNPIIDNTITATTGSDSLTGTMGHDLFAVGGNNGGDDSFIGGDGFDIIQGGSGDDVISFRELSLADSIEQIDGGGGINTVTGSGYADALDFSATELINIGLIDGGSAKDTIIGSAGNDTMMGGTGSDTLSGGAGDDVFIVNGSGQGVDIISGGEGSDTLLGSASDDIFGLRNLDIADSLELIDGGSGADTIIGSGYADYLDFSATNLVGIDLIDGDSGKDTIIGSTGNDTISGGDGADKLNGGDGSDRFIFTTGDGPDSITQYDVTQMYTDVLEFTSITSDSLWFSQTGDDLLITSAGTNDRVKVYDWYLGEEYQLDQIEVGDQVLLNNQVENLVSAMAAFDVPSGAGNDIPQSTQDALAPVLAANWS